MINKVGTVLLCLFVTQFAFAAEWEIQPYLLYTAEYSDNRRLTGGETTDTFGNLITGGARLGVDTATRTFYLEPRLVFRRYDKDPELYDSDDGFLELYFNNRSERSRFIFGGRYQRESTITSELANADDGNPDLEDPIEDDTGNTQISTRRERLFLRPQWTYDFSDRIAVALGGRYIEVDYDEVPGLTLSDYDSGAVDFLMQIRSSEKLRWGARLTASTYDADLSGNETDKLSLEFTLRYDLSPRTIVTASAGPERLDGTFLENGVASGYSSTEGIFNIGIARRTELTELTASFRRTISPSGFGNLKARNQLLFGIDRKLSERTSLVFDVRAYSSRSTADEAVSSDRDYARAELGIDSQLTRKLAFRLAYQYSAQERVATGVTGNSNTILLSFGYRPNRLAMSR